MRITTELKYLKTFSACIIGCLGIPGAVNFFFYELHVFVNNMSVENILFY